LYSLPTKLLFFDLSKARLKQENDLAVQNPGKAYSNERTPVFKIPGKRRQEIGCPIDVP
jgi:hypothetical protein